MIPTTSTILVATPISTLVGDGTAAVTVYSAASVTTVYFRETWETISTTYAPDISSTMLVSTAGTTDPTFSSSSISTVEGKGEGLKAGAKAEIVVGVIVVVFLALVAGWWIVVRRRRRRASEDERRETLPEFQKDDQHTKFDVLATNKEELGGGVGKFGIGEKPETSQGGISGPDRRGYVVSFGPDTQDAVLASAHGLESSTPSSSPPHRRVSTLNSITRAAKGENEFPMSNKNAEECRVKAFKTELMACGTSGRDLRGLRN
ncbi:hypothetical protein BDZ45DRAFT_735183 [Acephala macrosclerotiorum]|nr:hypothetical protein BDZ45DRAFT_735183 [Acephala macrosclerotiorum]